MIYHGKKGILVSARGVAVLLTEWTEALEVLLSLLLIQDHLAAWKG